MSDERNTIDITRRHCRLLVLIAAVGLCAAGNAAELVKDTSDQVLYAAEGMFDEVKENVVLAVTGQGLVVNNVATVGDMLEKTGRDLGATRRVYIHGDVIEFCSAALSREMLEADPFNLVFCPYTIQVFEVPEEPGVVFVGYRRLAVVGDDASRAALQNVNALLQTIVDEALAW